jgi:IclR family KDG regulon transcriptional repressor
MSTPASTPADEGFVIVKSADRALEVLELLAANEPMRLNEIAERMRIPLSSASNLIRTMARRRFLEYDPVGRLYRVGSRIRELARASERSDDLVTLAQPLMDQLVEHTSETVQLAQLDGIENVYLAISESPHPMKLVSQVGKRLFSHATGVGKTLLAQLSDDEVRRRFKDVELPRFTPTTIVDVEQLIENLHVIRERGYGTDDEEYVVGCNCVAVPVLGPRGEPVAAMSVSIPTARFNEEIGDAALQQLRAHVQRLSTLLGYVDESPGSMPS